jgi:hypothetical protein
MMPRYADFMYSLGLLDEFQSAYFNQQAMKAIEFILQKKFFEAFNLSVIFVLYIQYFVFIILFIEKKKFFKGFVG